MNYLDQIEEIGIAREKILDRCKIKASILSLTESAKYLVSYKDSQGKVDGKSFANLVFLGNKLYRDLSNRTVDMSPYTLDMLHSSNSKYRQLLSYKSYLRQKHTSWLYKLKNSVSRLNPFSTGIDDIEFVILGSVFSALDLAVDIYGVDNKDEDKELLELLLTLCLTTLYEYLGVKTTNYSALLKESSEAINGF